MCADAPAAHRLPQEARQLCDLALVALHQITLRLTRGKPLQDLGRFPGQVVLPKKFFKPNMQQSELG